MTSEDRTRGGSDNAAWHAMISFWPLEPSHRAVQRLYGDLELSCLALSFSFSSFFVFQDVHIQAVNSDEDVESHARYRT